MGIVNGNISGLHTNWEFKLSLIIFCGCHQDGYYKTINRLGNVNCHQQLFVRIIFKDNILGLPTNHEI